MKRTPASSQTLSSMPIDQNALLSDLKQRIATARVRAALAVNHELVLLLLEYWARHTDSST